MTYRIISAAVLCAMLGTQPLIAQTTTDTDQAEAQNLLTKEELHELVGPVALYPDTLLIQVLVAATYPLEHLREAQAAFIAKEHTGNIVVIP